MSPCVLTWALNGEQRRLCNILRGALTDQRRGGVGHDSTEGFCRPTTWTDCGRVSEGDRHSATYR